MLVFFLTFTNTLNSLFCKSKQHFKFLKSSIFYFPNLSKVSLLQKVSKQCCVFVHFWLFSQNNQPTLDWKFKNYWTKRLQKLPRKINVSLSLAKTKLAEKKNGWKLSYQSSEVMHPSICLTNCRKSFFSVTYLEHDFMIANLVRLNLVVLKILETS